jgi:hypothetical protein
MMESKMIKDKITTNKKKKSKISKMVIRNPMTNILKKCSPITRILMSLSKQISNSNKIMSTRLFILTWHMKIKRKLKKWMKLKLILRFVLCSGEYLKAWLLSNTKIQKTSSYHSKEWVCLTKVNFTMLLSSVLINPKDRDINLAKC